MSFEPHLSTALKNRSVVPQSYRLSLCPSPLPRFQQRCLCASRTMGESMSTIQRSPRISTSYKFARYSLPPMALQTVQVSVEPRLSTALKDRSVVPYSSPQVSARLRYHVSNSYVFLHRTETLAKGYQLSKLFSKAEPVPLEKEININLVYSSCLKHANEMLLGYPRQADQRTQSVHFPIVIHQSLDPAARSSAQAPSSLSLHALWALDRLRTRRRVGLRAVEVIICLITRDFSVISMTSQVSLSLYYSQ